MLYPLKFNPIYKEIVWGGQSLNMIFGRELPYMNTGESWDVACHSNGTSIIANGELKGQSLQYVFDNYKNELMGEIYSNTAKFPLLVKIIDARDRLSLQVHPQDEYAATNEKGELGKCEMWYVLHAKEGAKLAVGLKEGVTREQFKKGIEDGTLDPLVNEIEVKAGDVLNIPAGLLHTIEEDILIVEVQQNSDTVYRVYDWNRVGLDGRPRELHVKQALDVIDFKHSIKKEITKGLTVQRESSTIVYYIANSYFAIEKIILQNGLSEDTCNRKMTIYTCISGDFTIIWEDTRINVTSGESVLVPACLGEYKLVGTSNILKSYIPDIQIDFIKVLKDANYTDKAIKENIGLY